MGIIRGVFSSVMLVAALGCAKDMNLKDYQDQEALNDLAKYQAVQGTYTGMMKNAKGLPIGGIELHIIAQLSSQTSPGAGGTSPSAPTSSGTARATLVTELIFQDTVTVAQIRTASGYFDPNTGVYQADFSIPMQTASGAVAQPLQVSISGGIGDGHVRGVMQGVGFASQQATFDAAKGGDPLSDLAKMAKPIPGSIPEGQAMSFDGKVTWPAEPDPDCVPTAKHKCPPISKTENINMLAFFPVNTPTQHFINVFLPDNSKVLEINLNYGIDTHVNFTSANWDTSSGVVIAESQYSSVSTGVVMRHLTCTNYFFAQTSHNFSCKFWTDRTGIALITFGPATPAIPPTAP